MYAETDTPEEDEALAAPLSLAALRRLLGLASPYWRLLLGAGLLMLVSTGASLALPLLTKNALDRVVQAREIAALDRLVIGLLGMALLTALLSFAQFLLMAQAGSRIVMEMRSKLFAHLQRLPIAFFDNARSGELTSRLSNDVTLLQQTLTEDLVRFVSHLFTLVGGIALALVIDWRLTGVVVGLLALLFLMALLCGLRLRHLTRASLDALSAAIGGMTERLANVRLIRSFAREAYEEARMRDQLRLLLGLTVRAGSYEAAISSLAGVGFLCILLGVLWYGGRSVAAGHLTPGAIVGFVMTIGVISGPLASLAELFSRLQRAIGAADRLFSLLDHTPEPADGPEALPFPDGPGAIRFQEVRFGYEPGALVLRGLSLEMAPGRVTALVGASGSGKTTLTALLCRFYEPQSGDILIDGAPLARIARQALRERIGVVSQEPVLFSDTIRENIRYGRLEATDAQVEAAARLAHVDEFVRLLPQGYATVVGERGVLLSGGQRQRIAIARALLKNPRILILDEATSALDNHSERLVREALTHLMQGRTTLVIAHRLTTIENADQIALIQDGRIAEQGTHAELMRLSGRYAALHRGAPAGGSRGCDALRGEARAALSAGSALP